MVVVRFQMFEDRDQSGVDRLGLDVLKDDVGEGVTRSTARERGRDRCRPSGRHVPTGPPKEVN